MLFIVFLHHIFCSRDVGNKIFWRLPEFATKTIKRNNTEESSTYSQTIRKKLMYIGIFILTEPLLGYTITWWMNHWEHP